MDSTRAYAKLWQQELPLMCKTGTDTIEKDGIERAATYAVKLPDGGITLINHGRSRFSCVPI